MREQDTHSHYDGAIFYSIEDLSISWNLKKAEKNIPILINKKAPYSINEILEMYNIIKLFDTGIKLTSWDNEHYTSLKTTVNTFYATIGRFVVNFDFSKFIDTYVSIDILYIKSFWDMFEHYEMHTKIPRNIFENFLCSDEFNLNEILTHKKIVDTFEDLISHYMITHSCSAELLIDAYLVQHNDFSVKYYFPKSLSPTAKRELINSYINSENPNPNYLDVIVKGKKCNELKLDDNTRLSAKKKYTEYWKNHFSTNNGVKIGANVSFSNIEEFSSINSTNPLNPELTFSSSWISENLDYPSLLNNFIFMFEFVDEQYRSSFPIRKNQCSVLESVIGLKSRKAYPRDTAFDMIENIHTLEIISYDNELSKYNIRIEDLFKWFFEIYLKEEFEIEGFFYNASSESSTYLEKCRNICCELDSILKQFSMFVNNNCIDQDLIEMSSFTPSFSQIKSFYPKKYGYLQNQPLENASHLFFSSQSNLSFTEKTKDKYNTFFNLLCAEKMHYQDFYDYQKPLIDQLLKQNLLFCDDTEGLQFPTSKIFILREFYLNEVLCITYFNSSYVNELISNNSIVVEGTLFSKPEQDYLDYMLNDRTFDNGPQLRNRYIHGSKYADSNQNMLDYYRLLKILSLVILKINEEFCRRDDIWNNYDN